MKELFGAAACSGSRRVTAFSTRKRQLPWEMNRSTDYSFGRAFPILLKTANRVIAPSKVWKSQRAIPAAYW
jgi:hypothetical protein